MLADLHPHPRSARPTWHRFLTCSLAVASVVSVLVVAPGGDAAAATGDDWLSTVDAYRSMSGLAPVSENKTWSAQARDHSCYMLQNGISHDETPGKPGYTEGGDVAGNSGNVAVSSNQAATPRSHVELWMTGPFHAIGVLRHSLRTTGFGLCSQESAPTPWRSGGTLDVIRGIDSTAKRPTTPILFPGAGATVPLHSFITEFPDPLAMCKWSGPAGLPLIAMMPTPVGTATSKITGPNGPVETCTLHRNNVTDPTARAILEGDNAVVVMPREVLVDGRYTASVDTDADDVTWSFTVDRNAPLQAKIRPVAAKPSIVPKPAPAPSPPPAPTATTKPTADPTNFRPITPFRLVDSRIGRGTVRLRAAQVARVRAAATDVAAISANFVAVDPADHGYVTAYNCTANRPDVSTLGFRPDQVVANQAVVALDRGDLCLFALVDTDIIIDVNGYFESGGTSGFTPTRPERIHDSRRSPEGRMRPGKERVVTVAGAGRPAPAATTSVALNVTVADTADFGFLQVYPCGARAVAEISTINYRPSDFRPNSVVVKVGDGGRICFRSLRETDMIVDFTGFFSDGVGSMYQPISPLRLFDSRTQNADTSGERVRAGQVVRIPIAGKRGVPAGAKAVAVNLTATGATKGSFLTAYPCGARPDTSNVNIVPWQPVAANGAMVKLSADGELCVFALNPVHVIVDISGIYL